MQTAAIQISAVSDLLNQAEHRPWPLPKGPWLMTQTWERLLFAHWPVSFDALKPLIPPGLVLDTFEGEAWISLVPFEMDYRLRGAPWAVRFGELNLRTYVRDPEKPGVFFFSLDASDLITVYAARTFYALPYFRSDIRLDRRPDTSIHYTARRKHPGARAAEFQGRYSPTALMPPCRPGSLEYWLTERYCLYSVNPRGALCRAEVHHLPWPLHGAEADILTNSVVAASGIILPDTQPILHYSERLDVLVWPLKSC